MWVIADPDGDGLAVMTIDGAARSSVSRERSACDACGRAGRMGGGDDDAPTVEATARVGEFSERIEQAFKDAYGAEFHVVRGVERADERQAARGAAPERA